MTDVYYTESQADWEEVEINPTGNEPILNAQMHYNSVCEAPEEPEIPADPEDPEVPEDPEDPEQPEDPENPEVPGDLDGVSGVSEDDAIYLLQYILMPDMFPVTQNVDFDGNGVVNEDDAIYLLQHVLMPDMFPL